MLARTRAALRLGAWLTALVAAGCGDHEPQLGRVGGALPEVGDAMPDPQIPCEPDAVMDGKCRRCHNNPQFNGAPFPLLTWDDTQQPYDDELLRWEKMKEVIESGFMPFVELDVQPPVQDLTKAEKATMLAWLGDGAKPVYGVACP